MSRSEAPMEPTPLRRLRRGGSAAAEATAAQRLRTELGTLVDVREPKDAEEPILGPAVRAPTN